MPRHSSSWLAEMAAAMRSHGAIAATRRHITKDGAVEEWSITLGPPEMQHTMMLSQVSADTPALATGEALDPAVEYKRQRVFEIKGVWLTDDQLKHVPDGI